MRQINSACTGILARRLLVSQGCGSAPVRPRIALISPAFWSNSIPKISPTAIEAHT